MSCRERKFVSMLVCLVMTFIVCDSVPVYTDLLMNPDDISTLVKAASFLADYGFISPDKGNAPPDLMDVAEMTIAVKKMQKYAAVNQTGRLDQATVKMMNTARCGVHDEPDELMDTRIESTDAPGEEGNQRHKRYAVAGLKYKWDKTNLKYKITNYPDNSKSRITPAQVDQDTERAFQLWSDVTPLSFTKVEGDEQADLNILFGAFYHTDIVRDPLFDGLKGTLGHAFYPNSGWGDADGDVHLDDSEIFTHQEHAEGTDYLYTVTHEIGHALGLAHASEKSSLMFPYDKGYIPDLRLPKDDVQGIQLLYGRNPRILDVPDVVPEHPICSIGIDSLTMVKKILYVFTGNKFWKLSMSKNVIGPEEGTLAKDYFHNVKDGSSAVYTRWDGKTVFFRGRNYWIYDGTTKEQRTPLKIATLGVPKGPSAVMHDSNERHTYFFKWAKVWKYDETTQSIVDGFPKAAHKLFQGLPAKSRVQAAFIDKSGAIHLLVGREYYRFANGQELDTGYPKDFLVDYFDCQPQ
ncbi:collagenase 3-like [Asterias amurensis]|uniref:collagenase 3-like n=1 Tax=Asterias amurensis TaxID=7602 RepID=UPI003AB87A13